MGKEFYLATGIKSIYLYFLLGAVAVYILLKILEDKSTKNSGERGIGSRGSRSEKNDFDDFDKRPPGPK